MTMVISLLTLCFGSGILMAVIKYFANRIKKTEQDNLAVRLGLQALLRNELISTYNHYSEKGYAPIYAKENFENMWIQYHNLGANGVMDEIHEKFKHLPDRED